MPHARRGDIEMLPSEGATGCKVSKLCKRGSGSLVFELFLRRLGGGDGGGGGGAVTLVAMRC